MLEITEFSDSAQADRDMGGAPRPIAPAWHTVLMLLLVLAPLIQAIAYDRSHPGVPSQPPAATLCISSAPPSSAFFSLRVVGRSAAKEFSAHTGRRGMDKRETGHARYRPRAGLLGCLVCGSQSS